MTIGPDPVKKIPAFMVSSPFREQFFSPPVVMPVG
jgi:hypothetical protein